MRGLVTSGHGSEYQGQRANANFRHPCQDFRLEPQSTIDARAVLTATHKGDSKKVNEMQPTRTQD